MPHSTTLAASSSTASPPTTPTTGLKPHPLLARLHNLPPPPPPSKHHKFPTPLLNTSPSALSPRRRFVLTRTLSTPPSHARSKSLSMMPTARLPPPPPPPPPPPERLVNESFPPPSPRSRSPSVSSLETIPDTPEEEMREEEEDREEREAGRRRSMDFSNVAPTRSRTGNKRWSVCGAEKRADLELETIWEGGE